MSPKGVAVDMPVQDEFRVRDQLAMDDAVIGVRHLGQEIPIVGDDDNRFAEPGQDVHDALPGFGIEAIGGLVEEQGLGLHGQYPGQGHELLLAAGELVSQPIAKSGQPQQRQGVLGQAPGRLLVESPIQGPEGHVVEHRGIDDLVIGVLQQQADTLAYRPKILLRAHRPALEAHLAGIRAQQPHHDVQQRGLSRAVRPEKADAFPGPENEIQSAQHRSGRTWIGKGNIGQRQQNLRHVPSPTSIPTPGRSPGPQAQPAQRRHPEGRAQTGSGTETFR